MSYLWVLYCFRQPRKTACMWVMHPCLLLGSRQRSNPAHIKLIMALSPQNTHALALWLRKMPSPRFPPQLLMCTWQYKQTLYMVLLHAPLSRVLFLQMTVINMVSMAALTV